MRRESKIPKMSNSLLAKLGWTIYNRLIYLDFKSRDPKYPEMNTLEGLNVNNPG